MKLNLDNYMMEHQKAFKVKGNYIPRDISWIAFNERVLSCANNDKIPLNERFRFLSITDNNLNEFISVRFANAFHDKDKDKDLYLNLLKKIKKFKDNQNISFNHLKMLLKEKGYEITHIDNLTKKEKEVIKEEYMSNIFPILTPINISMVNTPPTLLNGQVCIAALVNQQGHDILSIIKIPNDIDPIYQIGQKIIYTEEIILYFLEETLFINNKILDKCVFSILKDASIILLHDNSKYIIDRMNDVLEKRYYADPVFINVNKKTSSNMLNILLNTFNIPTDHYYYNSNLVDYKKFSQSLLPNENESYKDFKPFEYENNELYYSLFETLKDRDILLHHPYDSYDTVVKFIQHAAIDESVIAIKQTLYRVSSIDSPIVEALCQASKNGKNVTVLIEIKARFDEENNIHLIKKLKDAGATVLVGLEYLKTHCKLCVVIRKENDKLKIYSHMGTGNYNEKTARVYTDISYLTSKQKIGIDLLYIFNIISGISKPDEKLQKISYSPVTLRKTLNKCIDREISNAKKNKPAEIFMKLNSLSDPLIINKLYEASNTGVKIYIICRGICSILPTKNIFIKSIVGRFLEHSRIYYFKNGGNDDYYISSADLLTRNLDKRVETLISLKDSNVIKQLKWIIKVFKEDKKNSFIMKEDGTWKLPEGEFDAHQWFIDYSNIKKTKKKWKK